MKDWKTTLYGALLGAAYALISILQAGAKIEDWKTWIIPMMLAFLGYLVPDKQPPLPPGVSALLVLCALTFFLPSCNGTFGIGANGKPTYGISIDPVKVTQTLQLWADRYASNKAVSVTILDPNCKPVSAATVSPSGVITPAPIPAGITTPVFSTQSPEAVARGIQSAQQQDGPAKTANVIVVDSTGRGVSSVTVSPKGVVTTEHFAPAP